MTREDFQSTILPLGNKLYRFACRLMNNPTDAEDALQDVLIKLWKNRKQLSKCISIEAFAMRVAKNHCLDKLKAQKHHGNEWDSSNDNSANDTLLYAETENQIEWMQRIMTTLPATQRMILELRDIEAYDYEEIAAITGLNINAIRVNLCRARKYIREQFTELESYENA